MYFYFLVFVYKRRSKNGVQTTKIRFFIYFHYKRREEGQNWERVFYFELEVGEGATKSNQRNSQAASGQTKTNVESVVEAKGEE